MSPNEYCQQKAAASGSSFYYSFAFLPPRRRQAITALYAFCREVDDVVDEGGDAHEAAAQLDEWRAEIERLHAGIPRRPVTQALQEARRHFNLPKEQLLEIIDGMEMDLHETRYPDFKALQLYCHRVAGVVGLLAAEIFGYQDRRTRKYAHDLGIAFQLTNIIRDVGEDARRGRIYLPLDELARYSIAAEDILEACNGPANSAKVSATFKFSDVSALPDFPRLMAFQIERAERYYDQAMSQLPASDRKAQRPGLVMAAIYRAILDEIKRSGGQTLTRRVSLSAPRKLWLAWRSWIKG